MFQPETIEIYEFSTYFARKNGHLFFLQIFNFHHVNYDSHLFLKKLLKMTYLFCLNKTTPIFIQKKNSQKQCKRRRDWNLAKSKTL